jgi:hypothetical protein
VTTPAATTAAPATSPVTSQAETTTTTAAPLDTRPQMIVQVLAHRPTTSRADVGNALAGDVSPVIDLVEYDLAAVSTLDEATGDRLLLLDVPIAQRANTSALELVER